MRVHPKECRHSRIAPAADLQRLEARKQPALAFKRHYTSQKPPILCCRSPASSLGVDPRSTGNYYSLSNANHTFRNCQSSRRQL